MVQGPIYIILVKNGVPIIFFHLFLTIGSLSVHLIYVHWIIVFGMNWMKITAKTTANKGIKHSVKKKNEKENALNSVCDFTKQLRLIKKEKGEYIR